MNAPPMDLVAGDADPMKRSANRNKAPEAGGADFSLCLGDQMREEDSAQQDPDVAVTGMVLAMPATVGETAPKAQAMTGEIAASSGLSGSDLSATGGDVPFAATGGPQQDSAPPDTAMASDDAVEVFVETVEPEHADAASAEVEAESADLAQDTDGAETQLDMDSDHEGGERSDPVEGDSGRGFSADAQALYGATTALNARHASAAQQAQLVSQQIVQVAQATPEGTVELALSPEELGHLKMVLHSDDGKLHVAIQAERPETQDLLRRHVDGLEKDFRQAGYAEVTFSIGEKGQDRPDRPAGPMTAADAPETENIAPPPRTILRVTGGLDLRV